VRQSQEVQLRYSGVELVMVDRSQAYRRNNRRDGGRLVIQLLGWWTNNVLVPQLLGRSLKSKKFHVLGSPLILSIVVTKMQDLHVASEFSKFLRG